MLEMGEQSGPPDERAVAWWQVGERSRPRQRRPRSALLREHARVGLPQRGCRIDAELIGERASAPLVSGEGVGLSTHHVKGVYEPDGQRFP